MQSAVERLRGVFALRGEGRPPAAFCRSSSRPGFRVPQQGTTPALKARAQETPSPAFWDAWRIPTGGEVGCMAHTLNSPLRGQQQDGSGGRRSRRSSPPAGVPQFLQGASLAWHGRQVPPPRIRSLVGSRVQNLIDFLFGKGRTSRLSD